MRFIYKDDHVCCQSPSLTMADSGSLTVSMVRHAFLHGNSYMTHYWLAGEPSCLGHRSLPTSALIDVSHYLSEDTATPLISGILAGDESQ